MKKKTVLQSGWNGLKLHTEAEAFRFSKGFVNNMYVYSYICINNAYVRGCSRAPTCGAKLEICKHRSLAQ